MKNGKLSKREMETLNRAYDILNDWIDWQEAQDPRKPEDSAYWSACDAAGSIGDFLWLLGD